MGKSLYRSYRSTSFDEIVGQDHITRVLKNSLKSNSISHAYLLSGPRGVGKTSIARIFAYAVNEQEYSSDTTNLDIIEIDAASNRRIDEIREIRERVHIAPSVGKYKVYIIDEVHMLTKEAFNALLKTLEEPPEHVIFILATTELQKVPDTIVSRCIKLTFRPIDEKVISSHLAKIAKQEKIQISKEALDLLAEHGRGSFRDAISLLEQVKHTSDKVEVLDVSQMLGLTPETIIRRIADNIATGNIKELNKSLDNAFSSGTSESMLATQLGAHFREMLTSGQSEKISIADLLQVQKDLLDVAGSPKPRVRLELCLYEITLKHLPDNNSTNETPEQSTKSANIDVSSSVITKQVLPKTAKAHVKTADSTELWPEFLESLKKRNNTLYGVLRMAEVNRQDSVVHLAFRFPFHQKQVNESKNKSIIIELLSSLHGRPVEVSTSVIAKSETAASSTGNSLENVSNIFGTPEVLES